MKNTLVVYYSLSTHTRTLARQLAGACDADLEAIEDGPGCARRSGAAGYAKSAVQAAFHLAVPIRRAKHAPRDYELVLIGTPIWFWNVSSPVRTYVAAHRNEFRRVAFFCSYGGSGDAKVFRDFESLSGRTPVATLAVTEAEVNGQQYDEKLARFVAKLQNPTTRPEQTRRGSKAVTVPHGAGDVR